MPLSHYVAIIPRMPEHLRQHQASGTPGMCRARIDETSGVHEGHADEMRSSRASHVSHFPHMKKEIPLPSNGI